MGMRTKLLQLLRGSFLTSENSSRHWKFILFLFSLAVIMIYAAHRAEAKVHRMASLTTEVNALKGKFVVMRTKVQKMQLESSVKEKVRAIGLVPPAHPPLKIVVQTKEE